MEHSNSKVSEVCIFSIAICDVRLLEGLYIVNSGLNKYGVGQKLDIRLQSTKQSHTT